MKKINDKKFWECFPLLYLVTALILYKLNFFVNFTVSILYKVYTCAKLRNLVFAKALPK